MMVDNLPKVGDLAEARSFQNGYRGAWFRCKVRDITKRKGQTGHLLEYYDFPDEKLKWTKLYQVPHHINGKTKEKHRVLMIRPGYPPIYSEKQVPHVSGTELAVIVDDSWKVGDLVDWWTTGCYWCGTIVQLLGDDKAKIALKPPPLGEGSFYDVSLKELRPSLDWSPEHGWTIPTQEGDTGHCCARLMKPIDQVIDRVQNTDACNTGQEIYTNEGKTGSSAELSVSAPNSSNLLGVPDEIKSIGTSEMKNSAELAPEDTEEELNFNHPLKGRSNGGNTLNSLRYDTLEAAVLDLEEYINKVKWLKTILHNGIATSDASRPQWEFIEPKVAPKNSK